MLHPVAVLIPGFLAPRSDFQDGEVESTSMTSRYWGTAIETAAEYGIRAVPVAPSGAGSLHDRAVEIFYQLIGGTVDYGESHSKQHKHSRFGRTYAKGLYPSWNADHPVHLIGHSYGGATARALRHLLARNFFASSGVETSGSWVLSVTAINSPLNGALSVYALGAKVKRKEEERSEIVPLSAGFMLGCIMHVFEFAPGLNLIYDFGLDHFGLKYSISKLLESIFVKSMVFELKDVSNYDMTCHAMAMHNARWETNRETLYLSFVGDPCFTSEEERRGEAFSDNLGGILFGDKVEPDISEASFSKNSKYSCCGALFWWCILLASRVFIYLLRCSVQRHWHHVLEMTREQPHIDAQAWQASGNDGLVSCKSQSHPLGDPFVIYQRRLPVKGIDKRRPISLRKGVWHVFRTHYHHLGIVPFPECFTEQREIFKHIFACLAGSQHHVAS